MRILLAGLLGGIAMFIWSSVAHIATPLGMVGVSTLPNESVTVDNLASSIGDKAGLYLFPVNMGGTSAATGVGGFLVFNPHAPMAMQPGNLVIEFLTEVVESLIAAWLLAQAALAGYAMRVGFVTAVGLAASIATNLPYWNWYKFPVDFTLAAILITVVGYLAAGLAIAAVLKPKVG